MKTVLQKIILLIVIMMFGSTAVYSESNNNQSVSKLSNEYDYGNILTNSKQDPELKIRLFNIQIDAYIKYVLITAILYAFSLIIIIILMKMTPNHEAKDLVTLIGLVSVIFGTILLVLMVGDTEQLTAPMGILGAIAGYLFGVSKRSEKSEE